MVDSIDKYKIIEHIGDGCFSDVYLVKDRALDTIKVIKILKDTDINNFNNYLEEAKILYDCKSKYIVRINEANVFRVDGIQRVILDMEHINGKSLEECLKVSEVPVFLAVKYMTEILYALELVHDKDILHRDIKPANILIDNNIAKLSDFGLSTKLGSNYLASCNGYITHLAPECFEEQKTSVQSDIFAVGITLFRCINQILDWETEIRKVDGYVMQIRKGTLYEKIGFKDYVPKKIIRIIKKACATEDKRYKSAHAMRVDLEKLKLHITWAIVGTYYWEGYDVNKIKHQIKIIEKRNSFILEYRKKDRIQKELCYNFATKELALKKLYNIVAETMYRTN